MIKQPQIQNKSIATTIQNRAARNQNEETIFSVGTCTPVQTYPTQYYVFPNYEGPENSMTVREAECTYESDSYKVKTSHKYYVIIYSNQYKF